MYRISALQDCLYGLVGYRQNNNPDYPTLPASLIASSSGLYFQDEHPLLMTENLDQALKNYDAFNYPAYDNDADYVEGDKVRYATDGKVYEATADGTGNLPTDADYWEEVPLLAQRLEQFHKAAINKVLNAIFEQKKLDKITKSIFENVQLFDGIGDISNKEIKAGRFVGFQIAVESYRDLSVILKRLGTQFSSANPDFQLYLYHSSQLDAPIKIFELNLTRANSFQWSALQDAGEDYVLRYLSDDYAPGGCFYLGYYEDDLVGQAINRGYTFGKAPQCTTCNRDYAFYSNWSAFMQVTPISVPAGAIPAEVDGNRPLWDLIFNQYEFTKSYGLNLDLSVKCDVTDFLCREKTLFTNAILKQVAVDLLQAIAYSTRNNVIAKQTQDLALYELNTRENPSGASGKLDKALKAISFDLSELDRACLPCGENSNGPEYGSI